MKVEWSEAARADLARIFDFNLQRSDAWAQRVDARLVERAGALGRTPLMGRSVSAGRLRLLSIPDIQYVLSYRIDKERVTIIRVHSTREHRTADD